tara:strand:+ start:533 stop:724 length:192 start_codon:yes stop_codon:yes gene_type:complete
MARMLIGRVEQEIYTNAVGDLILVEASSDMSGTQRVYKKTITAAEAVLRVFNGDAVFRNDPNA